MKSQVPACGGKFCAGYAGPGRTLAQGDASDAAKAGGRNKTGPETGPVFLLNNQRVFCLPATSAAPVRAAPASSVRILQSAKLR